MWKNIFFHLIIIIDIWDDFRRNLGLWVFHQPFFEDFLLIELIFVEWSISIFFVTVDFAWWLNTFLLTLLILFFLFLFVFFLFFAIAFLVVHLASLDVLSLIRV